MVMEICSSEMEICNRMTVNYKLEICSLLEASNMEMEICSLLGVSNMEMEICNHMTETYRPEESSMVMEICSRKMETYMT